MRRPPPSALALVLFACAPAPASAPPSVRPAPAPAPVPEVSERPPVHALRPLAEGEPRVVVITSRGGHPRGGIQSVVVVGHGGERREAELVPHPGGGGWLMWEARPVGRAFVVREVRRGADELVTTDGTRHPLDAVATDDLGRYLFLAQGDRIAILDPVTGAEVAARDLDPATDGDGTLFPVSPILDADLLLLWGNGEARGEELQAIRLPSLQTELARPGSLAGQAGRFVLISTHGRRPRGGGDPPLTALEVVDLAAGKPGESIRVPRALQGRAGYAVSADGKRVARSWLGGVDVYDRASKRWTQVRKAERAKADTVPDQTSVAFTADGATLCVQYKDPLLFPEAPVPAGTHRRLLFDALYRGYHDGVCVPVATPKIQGADPLVDAAHGVRLLHEGGALSPGRDLGAFLDVEPDHGDAPRRVWLTVVELPAGRPRFQVPIGRWVPSISADKLSVSFTPDGVDVDATTSGDEGESPSGLFDAATGKRIPSSVPPPGAPVTLAEIVARAGYHGGPKDAVTLAFGEGMASVLAGGTKRLLAVLVPSGKGVVALLDGGAFDTAGEIDEATLACQEGSRVRPLSTCRDRTWAGGALADALEGKRTWLDEAP